MGFWKTIFNVVKPIVHKKRRVGRSNMNRWQGNFVRSSKGRMENLITALADASLPTLEVSRHYEKEEAKKKELEARLSR